MWPWGLFWGTTAPDNCCDVRRAGEPLVPRSRGPQAEAGPTRARQSIRAVSTPPSPTTNHIQSKNITTAPHPPKFPCAQVAKLHALISVTFPHSHQPSGAYRLSKIHSPTSLAFRSHRTRDGSILSSLTKLEAFYNCANITAKLYDYTIHLAQAQFQLHQNTHVAKLQSARANPYTTLAARQSQSKQVTVN
jgi:hypothetical protein